MDLFLTNLFGIITMSGNYEERKVANDKRERFILDTARVTDRPWTYETAVQHKDFNNNDWIILDGTNDLEEAKEVHQKWLKTLDAGELRLLEDYYTGEVFFKEERKNG